MAKSKIQALQDDADKAYALDTGNAEDNYAWFYAQPLENLTALWAIACVQGAAWDDEVYEALDQRGWFDEEPDESVLLCILCRYIGLNHDGDHIVPPPKKEGT